VNLTINPVNDAPVCATPVTSIGGRGRQQSGTLHCTDVDSPSLSYALDTQASNGTATVDPDGSWTYTPESDTFTGSDSFTFTANDGSLDSDAATMDVTVSPDTTAPVVQKPSLLLTTAAVNESASIQISWSATDDDTGVAGYEVQAKVGSGAWTTIYTGTGTSITKSYHLNSSLTWRVRATDRADNTSAWVATPVHRLSAYQETSSSISYTGTWSYRKASASSGTGYKYDTASGKYAQLKFTGMQVLYVAPKLSTAGYVKVYVNGVYKGRKSLHRSSTAYGQVIYRATWSTSATRTIRIVNAQSGKKTTLDAFIVLR
jgi:VCBS repeat-containing protein